MNTTTTHEAPTVLKAGTHTTPQIGMSLLEAVSYVANEPHSDRPACCWRVLAAHTRGKHTESTSVFRVVTPASKAAGRWFLAMVGCGTMTAVPLRRTAKRLRRMASPRNTAACHRSDNSRPSGYRREALNAIDTHGVQMKGRQ